MRCAPLGDPSAEDLPGCVLHVGDAVRLWDEISNAAVNEVPPEVGW